MSATITTERPLTQRPPITFRLPKPGVPDPYFGLSRAYYYTLEQRGVLKLVRITEEGKERGITLIPYKDMLRFVQAQAEAEEQR